MKDKDQKRLDNITKKIALVTAVIGLITAGIVLETKIMEEREKSHPQYPRELTFSWRELYSNSEYTSIIKNAVGIVSSEKSDGKNSSMGLNSGVEQETLYSSGAELVTLYHNLDDQQRVISGFKVTCSDIEKDNAPALHAKVYDPYWSEAYHDSNRLICEVTNHGWGTADKIKISLYSITKNTFGNHQDSDEPVLIDKNYDYYLDNIQLKPGEKAEIPLLSEKSFLSDFHMEDEPVGTYFAIIFKLTAVALNQDSEIYQRDIWCQVDKDGDEVRIHRGWSYEPDVTPVVIKIPVSQSSTEKYFDIRQVLPAKETLAIPIIVSPEQSCRMTVQIDFQMLDGEVIHADPLNNAHFFVDYLGEEIIDGSTADLNSIDTQNRKVSFPYVSGSFETDGNKK